MELANTFLYSRHPKYKIDNNHSIKIGREILDNNILYRCTKNHNSGLFIKSNYEVIGYLIDNEWKPQPDPSLDELFINCGRLLTITTDFDYVPAKYFDVTVTKENRILFAGTDLSDLNYLYLNEDTDLNGLTIRVIGKNTFSNASIPTILVSNLADPSGHYHIGFDNSGFSKFNVILFSLHDDTCDLFEDVPYDYVNNEIYVGDGTYYEYAKIIPV